MSRFFINETAVDRDSNKIVIKGDDVNHIKNVLRMACGDRLVLCDGKGTDYHAGIESFEKDRLSAVIMDAVPNRTEPPIDVTLFQGIPKSDKMDLIIQKSVEMGAKRVVPVLTERTVVRFDSRKDADAKTTRWQRICLEAAKQCDRGIIPVVETPLKFESAIKLSLGSALSIIPYENETDNRIKACLNAGIKGGISIFIGPEGGYTEDEIRQAVQYGIKPVTLGPRILRTETAGIAVLSILMYELGDVG